MQKNGGAIRRVSRTADHNYYQAWVGPRHSVIIGIEHNGRFDIPTSDPEFQRIFVKLVEDVRRVVERSKA